jgi:hypothetical protein
VTGMDLWVFKEALGGGSLEREGRTASEPSDWWQRQQRPELEKTTASGHGAARGGAWGRERGGGEELEASGAAYIGGVAVPVASRRRHGGGRPLVRWLWSVWTVAVVSEAGGRPH